MAKYLRRRKPPVLFLMLLGIVFAVILFVLSNSGKQPVCGEYELVLPEGYVLQRDDKTQNSLILRSEEVVGGILHCPFGISKTPALYPINHQASEVIIATLKAADAPGTNPDASDYMDYIMEGGSYSYSCVASFVNRNAEYKHYMIFCEKGILTLWFDTAQVESEIMDSISKTFSVVQP